MGDSINIKIQTQSNLFIGGMPTPFEIGGIDQQTATDQEGFPCIPGSSLKGALRTIVREDRSEMANEVKRLLAAYLKSERDKNWPRIRALVEEKEALDRIESRYLKANQELSAEYLFGIEGFNNTPKLLFSDLILCNEFRDKNTCFSIDMKNSIELSGNALESNPRTYQTARRGLVFEGEIRFYKIGLLGEDAEELCKKYIIFNLLKFNEGFYRLGNSKSRGYGKVQVLMENKDGEGKL